MEQDDSSKWFPKPTKKEILRKEIQDILNRAFFGLGIGNYNKDKYVIDRIIGAVEKHEESK